jgi:transposase
MVTPEQKAFCVPQFVKHESIVSVQQAFRRQFNSDPPSPNSIRRWYQQFQTTGCLCKGKGAGRPRVSEQCVERVRQSLLRSPKKSVHHAGRELEVSSMTVWRVLRKKPYHLHLRQFLKPTDNVDRSNFCIKIQDAMTEEGFLDRVV